MSYNSFLRRVQSLVLSTKGKPSGVDDLYYKGESIYHQNNRVEIEKGGLLDLFTYFNMFNLNKWSKYTKLNKLFLQLNIHGTFRIRVLRHTLESRFQVIVYDEIIKANGLVSIPVQSKEPGGLYSVDIKAIDKSILLDGGWYTYTVPSVEKPARIALIICTYKREYYLLRNLATLNQNLPENWNVFIIDNGQTLSEEITGSYDDRFHFYKNPNTGGSGGFARGLIEVMNDSNEWTHALFMDDDVIIEPAALERTDSFINIMRPEYKRHFISGAMLRMDTSSIQHESGAYWNGVRVKHCKHNYNLAKSSEILKNEKESGRKNQYAAWWYCVIPITENLKNNLPFPLFINGDDIEYSMRSSDGIIHLNGISIWHEPFNTKYNPIKQHYLAVRNGLIINTRHNFSLWRSLALVYLRLFYLLVKGNRAGAKLVLNGFADFLKGSKFLVRFNNEKLFNKKNKADMFKEKLTIINTVRLTFLFIYKYIQLKKDYKNMPLTSACWDDIHNDRSRMN